MSIGEWASRIKDAASTNLLPSADKPFSGNKLAFAGSWIGTGVGVALVGTGAKHLLLGRNEANEAGEQTRKRPIIRSVIELGAGAVALYASLRGMGKSPSMAI